MNSKTSYGEGICAEPDVNFTVTNSISPTPETLSSPNPFLVSRKQKQQSRTATIPKHSKFNNTMSSERLRSLSTDSESSISGIPITLRREDSVDLNPAAQSSTSSPSSVASSAAQGPQLPLGSRDVESEAGGSSSKNHSNNISLDFSYLELDFKTIEVNLINNFMRSELITTLNLSGNQMSHLPDVIEHLVNLRILDISQNLLSHLPDSLNCLSNLTTMIASNNQLVIESFPKDFGHCLSSCLKVLSLGGNQLSAIPSQVLDLSELRSLYLGSNQITEITNEICRLENLRVLYLGGNLLTNVPPELGFLPNLQALSLCENKLISLPPSIALLRNLKSLGLHKNQLTALPPEIVKLRGLHELSLRNNPLVCRFVKDFTFDCPSLLELAGRCIKTSKLAYDHRMLPAHLVHYLETARRCVNAKCKGVYFDSRVEHIKFVDFCGIYRLPLLQYLCSPSCTVPGSSGNNRSTSSDSSDTDDVPLNKMKRVLLG